MKRSSDKAEIHEDSDWIGAKMYDEKPGAISRVIIFVVCAAVISATLVFGMVDSWALAGFCLLAGAVALLWLADAWQTKQLRYGQNSLPLFVLALALIGAIQLLPLRKVELAADLIAQPVSSALSLDPFATRLAVAQLAAMLIFFAAALAFINNQKRLQTVTVTIIIFGFLLGIFGIIQFFIGEGKIYWLREPFQAVPFGPFINRHHFAACMMMIMGLTLGLLYTGAVESQKRALHFFAVIVMGIGLLLTTSRGALISLLGVLAFLTLATFLKSKPIESNDADELTEPGGLFKNRIAVLGAGLAVIVALVAVMLLLGDENSLLRSVGISTMEQADASNGRFHFWQTAWQIIKNNLFFGVGLDAFGVAYTRYDTWSGQFRIERAHNDYLQVFAESGIVGLLLILGFIAVLFRNGWRIFRQARDRFRRGVCLGALAGCLGILIHSLFDFPLRTPSNLLLFLMLAALATVNINYPKLYRRRSNKKTEES